MMNNIEELTDKQAEGVKILARHLYSTAVIELQQLRKLEIRNADLDLYEPDGSLKEGKFRSIMKLATERMLYEMEDSLQHK